MGHRRQECSQILPAPQLGMLSHVPSFPWDWHRWTVVSHGCAKRNYGPSSVIFLTADVTLPLCLSGLLLSPAEYKSAIMALAGELQPSSPHGRVGYKATAKAAWRLWYPQCWLAHEMNLHAAEPSWDSCNSWCFLPTDQAGWLFKAVITSWPYMQPSLQTSFPLLQDQEHKDDKCLSLALEQHEGHCLPWCNCFLC